MRNTDGDGRVLFCSSTYLIFRQKFFPKPDKFDKPIPAFEDKFLPVRWVVVILPLLLLFSME